MGQAMMDAMRRRASSQGESGPAAATSTETRVLRELRQADTEIKQVLPECGHAQQ